MVINFSFSVSAFIRFIHSIFDDELNSTNSKTGETIKYSYNCNTTELSQGVAKYEAICYPDYNTIQTFSVPKSQDSATILCERYNNYFQLALAFAIPCNLNPECYDGSDEFGCEFPEWLIPSLFGLAGAVLCTTHLVYLHKSIKSTWKKKMQFQFRNSHLSIESEKLYKIAVLIERGDVKKIHEIYCQEVVNNGDEKGALCHFKVIDI